MVYTVLHFIEGKTSSATSSRVHTIYNPALGEKIGQVYCADEFLCTKAVASAKAAWPQWSNTPPVKRARILFKFRDLVENCQADLAKLVTQEHGKTLADAKGSIARAIEVVEYHCGIISQLQGTFSTATTDIDCHTIRQSLGVCAGVSPFNFPVMVPIWLMIPAIACGNTFILKPSEQDPSAALRLVELLSEAGLPDGVVNCVQGDKETVNCLMRQPDICAFAAVASTPVAETIYQTTINQGKRVHTFGGAKNHCLIMPDADLTQAAKAVVGAAYGSAGERCMAISAAILVGEATAERFLEPLIALIKAIRIDAGSNPETDMGPLISRSHRQKIILAIEQGVEEGAKLLIDGRNFIHPDYPEGFFVGPSLFDCVHESMSIYQNELFGPVLVLMRIADFNEGVALINRHQYGNGSVIFTRDGYTARKFSQEVQTGMVGINVPIPVPIASHPFGGWKRSFFGDMPMHGDSSINFYTRPKTITSQWLVNNVNASSFTMPIHN